MDDDESEDIKSPVTPQLFIESEDEDEMVLKSDEKIKTHSGKYKKHSYTYEEGTIEFLIEASKANNVEHKVIRHKQHLITPRNRFTLLEWIMELSDKFHLKK